METELPEIYLIQSNTQKHLFECKKFSELLAIEPRCEEMVKPQIFTQ
jgi:hypothetical protein